MPAWLGYNLNLLNCILYYEAFILLTFHFFYRLISVTRHHLIRKHFARGLAGGIVFNVAIVAMVAFDMRILQGTTDMMPNSSSSVLLLTSRSDHEYFFADVMMREYAIDLRSTPAPNINGAHYVHSPTFGAGPNWSVILVMLSCGALASMAIMFNATCALLIIRAVKTRSMSCTYRRLQVQLLRALVVQFTIPVVFTVLPFFCIVVLPATGIDLGQLGNIMAFFSSAFPAIDPICIILAYPKFRVIFIGFFRRSIINALIKKRDEVAAE